MPSLLKRNKNSRILDGKFPRKFKNQRNATPYYIYRGEIAKMQSRPYFVFTYSTFPKHPYLVSENLTLRPKSCVVVG